MKKSLLFLISFLFLSISVFSQNGFSISPESFDDSYNENLSNVNYFRFAAEMANSSDTTLAINWNIINIDLPSEWGLSVGDKNMSYPPFPQIITNNGYPLFFHSGETNIPFFVDVYPKEISGCGFFDVIISLDESGLVLDTIEYKISINDDDCLLSSVSNDFFDEMVELFPNPFVDNLKIKTEVDIQRVIIYSLNGNALVTQLTNFDKLNIQNLEAGIYFVEIVFTEGHKAIKKIIKEK